MSDSLANVTAPQATPNGQSQPASGEQSQSSANGQTPNGQSAQDENIKNLQRVVTQKDVQAKQALNEAQQARNLAAQLQQRMQEMEDRMAPDDFTRLELRAKRAEEQAQQYAAAYNQKVQAEQEATARDRILGEIAERYGVDVDAIKKADDRDHAVELAIEARDKKRNQQQQQQDDKRTRNMPDLGGGAPRTASTAAQAEWDELVRTRDSAGQMRWIRENKGK